MKRKVVVVGVIVMTEFGFCFCCSRSFSVVSLRSVQVVLLGETLWSRFFCSRCVNDVLLECVRKHRVRLGLKGLD